MEVHPLLQDKRHMFVEVFASITAVQVVKAACKLLERSATPAIVDTDVDKLTAFAKVLARYVGRRLSKTFAKTSEVRQRGGGFASVAKALKTK